MKKKKKHIFINENQVNWSILVLFLLITIYLAFDTFWIFFQFYPWIFYLILFFNLIWSLYFWLLYLCVLYFSWLLLFLISSPILWLLFSWYIFCLDSFDCYILIFFLDLSFFFFNFVPKHLISFDFISSFGHHYFNWFFYLFLVSFSISPLIIFFHFLYYIICIVWNFNCFMVEYLTLLFF